MYAARSDVGLRRQKNEDSWNVVVGRDGKPCGVAVADGMGGHAAGAEASRIAVEELSRVLAECMDRNPGSDDLEDLLEDGFDDANRAIRRYAQLNGCENNCGTTLTALWMTGELLCVAHIGDSRAYLLRAGVLRQLTKDHSYVQELVDKGIVAPEDARTHPDKNRITRALGFDMPVTPDIGLFRLMGGDTLLVCSDGLWEAVTDEEMKTIVDGRPLEEAADALVRLANERGGRDNITVVIVRTCEGA